MAKKITLNAKLRNTAICGATETILIHQNLLKNSVIHIIKLENNGVKLLVIIKLKNFIKEN